MVLRYVHLSSDHLKEAAERISMSLQDRNSEQWVKEREVSSEFKKSVTNLLQSSIQGISNVV